MSYLTRFKNLRNSLALAFFMAVAATGARADVAVIVSARSPITSLTTEQIARIFLGKTTQFPNNQPAFPIDQVEGSKVRNTFYAEVVHKGPTQLAAYWASIIFTGNGQPPTQLEGNITIRSVVAKNRNAIGYIDKRYVNGTVRVILTIEKND